jgi:hypothetical protein
MNSIVVHDAAVKAETDGFGLVFYACCLCGWRGPNHPGIPTVAEASQRASANKEEHLEEHKVVLS